MAVFVLCSSSAFLPVPVLAQQAAGEYRQVNLDTFIATQRPAMAGTRTILVPSNVSFTGVLMEGPKPIKVSYLFEALSIMNVDPLPKVSHRMFVASREGKVMPVYVEDKALKAIRASLKVDEEALFKGYHVYNYSKGPAVVIEGIEKK